MKAGVGGDALAELKGKALDDMSRPVLGTMMLGTFGAMAHAGMMTGEGPTDKRQQSLLQQTGWQPYSFVIPDGKGGNVYVPFNRFEPASSLLGFAADMAEAKNAKDENDLLEKGIASFSQNLLSKTYLEGLASAAAVVHDPKQFIGEMTTNLAGSPGPQRSSPRSTRRMTPPCGTSGPRRRASQGSQSAPSRR